MLLLLMHAGALLCLLLSHVPWWLDVPLVLLIVFSFYYWSRDYGFFSDQIDFAKTGSIIRKIHWDENERWWLHFDGDRSVSASLLPTSLVHHRILVLNFKVEEERWFSRYRSLVILKDSTGNENLIRRLRIRLRWYYEMEPDNLLEPK